MKLCILVIASRGKEYDELILLWRSIKYPDWVKLYFVFADPNTPEMISVSGDTIFVRGKECICPGILYKTRAAMDYLLTHECFDYLLRSNLSSFFNVESLLNFLIDKPRTNAMFGQLMFERFLSGSGYIMTPDIIRRFLDWDYSEEVNPMRMYDDDIVGKFMMLYNIPRFTWTMKDAKDLNIQDAIQIRCHGARETIGFNGLDPIYSSASPDYFRLQVQRYNSQIYRVSE
jgi:hypothetical protein